MQLPVRSTPGVEAFGASPRGDVGSGHRIRVGYRTNGLAEAGTIRAVFIVPPGAEVTRAHVGGERRPPTTTVMASPLRGPNTHGYPALP